MAKTTLRQGLYNALKLGMEKSGMPISIESQAILKETANLQADSIIDFLVSQTFTITELRAAVELDKMAANNIDADVKQNMFIQIIGIYIALFKILIDPLKKIPFTKPVYSAIVKILGQIEQTILNFLPAGIGKGDVSVPVELSKDDTGMVAQGHAFVGAEAAGIGDDGSNIADELGEHTKVVLHRSKIPSAETKKLV